MDVVGIAVVGRKSRDDRFERRRPPRGYLQRVETAPGLALDADRTAAPGLARNPLDHLERIVLLLLQVLIRQMPVRFARAAHVDANRRIAVRGKIAMHGFIAAARAVAFAIRNVLEDRRDRRVRGIIRQPETCAKTAPVCERDPEMLDDFDDVGHPQRSLTSRSAS